MDPHNWIGGWGINHLASSPGSPIFSTLHAREKRGSLVKLITCVMSGGTNFHIWHNSKLGKIKATDARSSSSSISMLQSAMIQQAETLQSLFYESKTVICMVTRSCPRPGGTDLDVGTIELPCKSQFSTHDERIEGPPLADSQPFSSSFR